MNTHSDRIETPKESLNRVLCSGNEKCDDCRAILSYIDSLRTRVEELEIVCAEAYQVLGALASYAGVFCTDDVERALDNLAQRKRVHSDLLPWPKNAAPFLALENTVKRAEQAESDAEWLRARVLR